MTEQWNRVAEVFESAVEQEANERTAFVDEACGGDAELRSEVEALLAEADSPALSMMIDRPIGEVIADLLTDNAPVVVGTQLGPYRIESLLGAGGMGQVYRAKDTVLGREVAIKLMRSAFASDPLWLARFKREAYILASLNHPNIAAIYGLESVGGEDSTALALVMELVEGPTLAETISGRALPPDDAIALARQIAYALEAAHERGIVHRDLKPGNIKVREDGAVKVLDFGLAKAGPRPGDDGAHDRLPDSATLTSPSMTAAGIILGTAAYMSPEQAKGKPADKRSDIWALGCVLYEMLTGTRPFAGNDTSEVMASVLAREPDWTRLPATLPPALGPYLRRCLHKDPKQRIGDAQDVRLALEGAFDVVAPGSSAETGPRGWRAVAAWTSGAVLLAAAAGAAVWLATRPVAPQPLRVSRLQITPPDAAALTVSTGDHNLAITPDGSRLIYVGDGGRQLFVRALDSLEPLSVFTGTPRGPFVSPDGQWIGFVDYSVRVALKKIPITGGAAVTLAELDGPTHRGASWGPDGTIVFATTNPATGLQRVAAAGGPVTVLTRPDRGRGEADHGWPEFLPDGRSVLFTVSSLAGGLEAAAVAVVNLQTGTYSVLVRGGGPAHYVSTGHLLYATPGTLRAVSFDAARLEVRGTPVAVVHDVVTTESGAVDAVVAGNGTLAYVTGGALTQSTRTLVWVDRAGHETPIPLPPRAYVQPRLSPDETRVAVFVADQELDLWVADLSRSTFGRVTSGAGVDSYPQWMDNRRLIFSSQRTGALNLFSQTADNVGPAEQLTDRPNPLSATGITPHGRSLIFTETSPATSEDVMEMALDGTRTVTPLVHSVFAERNGIVSPDGRWLAYETNDSGRFQVFVRPFPNVNSDAWPVSTDGGTRPLWARSGRELIYVAPSGALMRVGVPPGPTWTPTAPTMVVKNGYFTQPGNPGRTYDISRDGQRFLMVTGIAPAPASYRGSLIVVLNWIEELKRLAPGK